MKILIMATMLVVLCTGCMNTGRKEPTKAPMTCEVQSCTPINSAGVSQ